MSLIGYNLNKYPLENHYRISRQYIHQSVDWAEILNVIGKRGAASIDVSNTISLFPHLELDTDYNLFCYMTSEYHGIWGRVVAIKKGESWEQKRDESTIAKQHPFGNKLDIPDFAVPPMEAIYNDGTAEGYFEAVLCSLFLDAIPYTRFEQDRWNIIECSLPENYDDAWDSRVAVADWSPRCSGHTLIAFRRVVENGIGASDGKDRIYLTQYMFQKGIRECLFLEDLNVRSSRHILDDTRYNETRRCCVFTKSSVLVAVQKELC